MSTPRGTGDNPFERVSRRSGRGATPARPTCPACRATVGRSARFCSQCGIWLLGSQVTTPAVRLDELVTGQAIAPEAAKEQLAHRLREAWLSSGKPTLSELADRLNEAQQAAGSDPALRANTTVSRYVLWRIFNGETRPRLDVLDQLADQFEVGSRAYHSVWLPLWKASHTSRSHT